MTLKNLLFPAAHLFCTAIMSQEADTSFRGAWREIDGLVFNRDLSRTALAKVDSLYTQAMAKHEYAEATRALIYQFTLKDRVNAGPVSDFSSIRTALGASQDRVHQAVLYSLLAKKYFEYFNMHSWQILGRTNAASANADVETWTTADFHKEITKDFLRSLRDKELLAKVNIAAYSPVIIPGNSFGLRPSLYDLLSVEALAYFESPLAGSAAPARVLNDPSLFGDVSTFLSLKIPAADSGSGVAIAIRLFQERLSVHSHDADMNAFADADIDRIDWANAVSTVPRHQKLFTGALERVQQSYPGVAAAARAMYLLAKSWSDLATAYDPWRDTSSRYGYTKALEIVERANRLHPQLNSATALLASLEKQILHKELRSQVEEVNVPGEPFRALITYRNIDTVYTRLIRVSNDGLPLTGKNYWKLLAGMKPYSGFIQFLPAAGDHQEHSTEIKVDALGTGSYILLSSTGRSFDPEKDLLAAQGFSVSNLSYVNNGGDIFILERKSGKPVRGARVRIIATPDGKERPKTVEEKLSDQNGMVIFTTKNAFSFGRHLAIFDGSDTLDLRKSVYIGNPTENDVPDTAEYEKKNRKLFLFTDRGIYRPGQAVWIKGLVVTRNLKTGNSKPVTDATGWLYLRDVSGKNADSLLFKLNEFGSFAGKFILPANALTGQFTLVTPGYDMYNADLRVEEYKRPLFSVQFEPNKSAYRAGDSITVTGVATAFSGNSLPHASVSYNVQLMPQRILYRGMRPALPVQVAFGQLTTDGEGKFMIRFKADTGLFRSNSRNEMYNFSVTADVTDINGETHSAATTIAAAYAALKLDLTTPDTKEADSLRELHVSTTNYSGQKLPSQVHIKMVMLRDPGRTVRKRYWNRPDQFVMSPEVFVSYFPEDEYLAESDPATWPAGTTIVDNGVSAADTGTLRLPGRLQPGYYRITVTARDIYGTEVKTEKDIRVFDRVSGLPFTAEFVYPLQPTTRPGTPAAFLRSGPAPGQFIVRCITRANSQPKNYSFIHSKYPAEIVSYLPDSTDCAGIDLSEAFVYHNRVYTHEYVMAVNCPQKHLAVTYSSFRDKTAPGSQETWTVNVKSMDSAKVNAELLTAMYDASLDAFRPADWSTWSLGEGRFRSNLFDGSANFMSVGSINNTLRTSASVIPALRYERLASSADQFVRRPMEMPDGLDETVIVGYKSEIRLRGLAASAKSNASPAMMDAAPAPAAAETAQPQPAPARTRTDFRETAFFLPQLRADSNGNYTFSFTMPDALTTWRWMSFAHTQNLAFGYNEAEIVTQKKLMVQPNAPRLVREGDNFEFSAKIVNMGASELTGQASLELIDPENNRPVDGWFQNVFPSQYFTVAAGQSFAVRFPVQVPFGYNRPLTWRIVARAGDYSDGEENMIPVLSNRMLVTESLPIFLPKDTTVSLSFTKLVNNASESLTQQGITVEYSSNPAWYAVQALPYLINYPYDGAEQVFNKFYATALAAHIVRRNPGIRSVFEQWRADSTSLQSNLSKNESLKQVLLQETPWVLASQNESEQKKQMAMLFDQANLAANADRFIRKLEQMQLTDGSFPWFAGGAPDIFITNYILTGIGRLKKLGALDNEISSRLQEIVRRAIAKLDDEAASDWQQSQKSGAETIGINMINYLYMRSFFSDILPRNPEVIPALLQQAKESWVKQNLYERTKLAVVCSRNGDIGFATHTILPSILENAVTDTAQGMYWKSMYAGWWYQSPIEFQSMMIAMATELAMEQPSLHLQPAIDRMKTWLLLNKQTNNWRTTIATADACYALLMNGSDWLTSIKQVSIQLGALKIDASKGAQAGTGYFKTQIDAKQVNASLGNITVSTRSAGQSSPSWGSVYWQYLEDMDKITPAATPLSVTRKLYIEKNSREGKSLQPAGEDVAAGVGDRMVVRLVLRSDRDMDYVHLKDLRAAAAEPAGALSGYKWQDGLGYYESVKDASEEFFISHLRKGTYVLEYATYVTQAGTFTVGPAIVECLYAPEFSAHSAGDKLRVNGTDR